MWLLRGSPGLLWKHLPLILHGVKGLMTTAPCILTNATFHLVSPLCSQKDVWHRTLKNTHFCLAFFLKLASITTQPVGTHNVNRMRRPTASSESWIIFWWSSKTLTTHVGGIQLHAMTEACNIKKLSFFLLIYRETEYNKYLIYCISQTQF